MHAKEYTIDLNKCVAKCQSHDELDRHVAWIAEQTINCDKVIITGTAPADILLRLGAKLSENNQENVVYLGEKTEPIIVQGDVV
jgi:hypothetical protein